MIGVKSTKEKIVARYDGVEYSFQPGATMALSEEAARHIFGYGLKDKANALLRLGWLPNGAAIAEAIDRLNQVQFLAVDEPKFREENTPLPRTVSDAKKPAELSPEEQEIAKGTLHLPHHEGAKKQFQK